MADLFTDDDLAAALRVTTVDEAAAAIARARATDYLRLELGVEFTSATRTVTERLPRSREWLALPGPITSVTSVTVDGDALTAVDDFEVTDRGIVCPGGFGPAADLTTAADWCSVVVVYVGGFTTIPTELATWGKYLGMLAYAGPRPGVRSTTVGGFSESYTDGAAASVGLPADVLKSLRAKYGTGRRLFGSVSVAR